MYKHYTFLVVFIFLLGFLLRFYSPGSYPFGFDQVQILDAAAAIRLGHPTLIGPRTGPASMFTGPLVYYLTSGLSFVVPSPWTVVALSLLIFVVTFWTLSWLVQHYLDNEITRIVVLTVFAFSPFQLLLDRIPWNPNLTFVASALIFFPLFAKKRAVNLLDLVVIALGAWLGYQAHFSGLLLPLLISLTFLLRQANKRTVLVSVGGTLVSLAPTIIFDMKHNFLNLKGMVNLLIEQGSKHLTVLTLLTRLAEDTIRSLDNLGRLLIGRSPIYLSTTLGLIILALFVISHRKKIDELKLISVWWLGALAAFVFYGGEKPEYYFLIQFPVLMYMISSLITIMLRKQRLVLISVSCFFLYACLVVLYELQSIPPLSIGNEMKVAASARSFLGSDGAIKYDMRSIDAVGLQYFLRDIPTAEQKGGHIVHVIYPYTTGPRSEILKDIVVWNDPRIDPKKHYSIVGSDIIVTPDSIQLLEDHNFDIAIEDVRSAYVITQDRQIVGELIVANRKQVNENQDQWQPVNILGRSMQKKEMKTVTLYIIFDNIHDEVNKQIMQSITLL